MLLEQIMENGTIYGLAGACAGLASGIFGIGGGIVVVPALLYIFHHSQIIPSAIAMHFAAGTSLAIMLVTAQSSLYAHHQLHGINWKVYARLWPGIVVGVIAGAWVADHLSTRVLQIIFGIFLLTVATKMLFSLHIERTPHQPPRIIDTIVSAFIGFKSGLLGVGGGAIIIPYLHFCGVEVRKIAGVTVLCTLTVAFVGSIVFSITGSNQATLPPYSTGYIFWPAVLWVAIPSGIFAPIGAKLALKLPVEHLKKGFVALLILTGIDLLL